MQLFEKFLRDKTYLQNVSPATISWYTHARRWLPNEQPTQAELNEMVITMRESGLKETGANAAIRAINVYLKWSGSSAHIRLLKEPQFLPATFTDDQVARLIKWRPQTYYDRRLHLLVLTLLDTAARISEVIGVHVSDVDLDAMLITLFGKGRRQRRVPISLTLRRVLYKFVRDFERKQTDFLLSSTEGAPLGRNVCLRDVKNLCGRLGFSAPPRTLHAFRHTAALHYLRKGGNVFALQKMLGHSSLEVSRRYANLSTDDLSTVHERLSLLGG